jgi:hypothetical protein
VAGKFLRTFAHQEKDNSRDGFRMDDSRTKTFRAFYHTSSFSSSISVLRHILIPELLMLGKKALHRPAISTAAA